MIEKIEKIARVKGVDHDVGNRLNSGRDHEDNGFATTLRRAINKKVEKDSSKISEAYALDINSLGGQSLFYFGATDLRALLN